MFLQLLKKIINKSEALNQGKVKVFILKGFPEITKVFYQKNAVTISAWIRLSMKLCPQYQQRKLRRYQMCLELVWTPCEPIRDKPKIESHNNAID